MKQLILISVLLGCVVSWNIAGILGNYTMSPLLVAFAEYTFGQRGIKYGRPSIKEHQEKIESDEQALPNNEQEKTQFKEDLDSFYTLVTRFERNEEKINSVYNELVAKWKTDPARRRNLNNAYSAYQTIDATWGS